MDRNRGAGMRRRAAALVLTAALTWGLLPAGVFGGARAAEAPQDDAWVQDYLNRLVEWGVMRGDLEGNLAPDREISRAEYVTMINRAYGYDQPGAVPFEDVLPSDWFYDDTGIAYQAGYFTGTSEKTASPNNILTREEAAVILGRNLMLRAGMGEDLTFTDSREMSDWSRGIIKSCAEMGVVRGYPDGSFQPQRNITRGEVASLLVNAIGTPIREPGEYSLGGVYGNVTVSSSGVTLRNTTIAGDLYISSGVGLGYVNLENVTVLGRIVASGAGESNKGENSILLRNVTAAEMVVDSPANQFVSIRAEGDTAIESTSVRAPAYLEDVTPSGYGLKYVELDGEEGIRLDLAGNLGEVVNLTPGSTLVVAQGSAAKLTVDEKAVNTVLTVENGAEVKELNLDVATRVSGAGDVDRLNVNANGSAVTMLPDDIVVRPGVTGNISGENMDTVAAAEASEDPRLLSGYPDARDVAPATALGVFSTNKQGTVYWAVSAITDGSVSEENLISPPTYNAQILSNGSVQAKNSNTELTAKITKLTSDGSYYLSAVLVDVRGDRSPVKVTSFSTPDDTVPNFASGYPVMTKIENNRAQAAVMPTKSCQLYYALLPKGSAAPKPADFKANAVTGNKGFGSMEVKKNTVSLFYANGETLKELETYDLYLWLTDFDGVKSSAVKKLTFTTVDGTPPKFTSGPNVTKVQAASVALSAALDEPGTIYWAVVREGEDYPKPLAGQSGKPDLSSEAAKLQVASGMNAVKSGKATVSAANRDVAFTVSGLAAQTAYDLYYVAQDKAGNYSAKVQMMKINSLDNQPPTVSQEFTKYNGTQKDTPLPNTDIRLVFSESVQSVGEDKTYEKFLDLYEAVRTAKPTELEQARNKLSGVLRNNIVLYEDTGSGRPQQVAVRDAANAGTPDLEWTVDYRFATVEQAEEGKMVVTLPTSTKNGGAESALNLKSGATYHFVVQGVADTSTAANLMGVTTLPDFTTVYAQVNISAANEWKITYKPEGSTTAGTVDADMSFQLDPISTGSTSANTFYDLMIWSDASMEFDLYAREGTKGDWKKVGMFSYALEEDGSSVYRTLAQIRRGTDSGYPFEMLNTLEEGKTYQYAVNVTKLGDSTDRKTWNKVVNMRVTVAAGPQSILRLIPAGSTEADWQDAKNSGVISVGQPEPFKQKVPFSDSRAPEPVSPYPQFEAGDTIADMTFLLDREGKIYYVVTPVTEKKDADDAVTGIQTPVPPTAMENFGGEDEPRYTPFPNEVPGGGDDFGGGVTNPLYLIKPDKNVIINGVVTDTSVRQGSVKGSNASTCTVHLTDLKAETTYYVYVMYQGTSQVMSEYAYCYKFTTEKIVRPILDLKLSGSSNVEASVDRTAEVYGKLMFDGSKMGKPFTNQFYSSAYIDKEYYISNPDAPPEHPVESGYQGSEYTVLDAMIDTYPGAGCSVFDQYASQTLKDQVASIIRGKTNDPATTVDSWHTPSLEMNQSETVSFDGMTGKTWYCFVAVARSPLGSGDAFRAVRPVQLTDSQHPMIIYASSNAVYDPVSGSLSGRLTVTFDEPLYFTSQSSTKQETHPIGLADGLTVVTAKDGEKYWPITSRFETIPWGAGVEGLVAGKKPALSKISTINFTLNHVQPGDSIVFAAGLCDEWTNGINAGACTIQIGYDKKSESVTITVSPEWDGRS